MGGGKGPIDHYACRLKAGIVIVEVAVDGIGDYAAEKLLRGVVANVPLKCRVIKRKVNF